MRRRITPFILCLQAEYETLTWAAQTRQDGTPHIWLAWHNGDCRRVWDRREMANGADIRKHLELKSFLDEGLHLHAG